jgi:hypothetical protein
MSGKKPRPLAREEMAYRDDRLFVIATEDTHAPKQYFSDSTIFRNPRIHVRVLPTEEGCSSPKHVMDRLDQYAREYALDADDVLWLMLDTDHWLEPNHCANFHRVCEDADKKGFRLAHSNPCFEVWLLLHFTDLAATEQFTKGQEVVDRLKAAMGTYNKRNLDVTKFSHENIRLAANRAEELDGAPSDPWPQKTGTHVYRIMKELLRTTQA